MRPIDDMLQAFEQYYSNTTQLRYSKVQRAAVEASFSWIGQKYSRILYDEIITEHPSSLRSLPDLAVIRKAASRLGNAAVYDDPPKVPLLEDKTEPVMGSIWSEFERRRETFGVADPDGLRRVLEKVKRGDASKYESWWAHCKMNGRHTAMPDSWDGEEFRRKVAEERIA